MILSINKAESLQTVFVEKNHLHTKHPSADRKIFEHVVGDAIFFMDTFHKDFNKRRKTMANAFFKNKIAGMIEIVKRTSITLLNELHNDESIEVIDLPKFTTKMQSLIIVNCGLGEQILDFLVTYEEEDGTIRKVPIYEAMTWVGVEDSMKRCADLLPEFRCLTSFERRYLRNCKSLRGVMEEYVRLKRKDTSWKDGGENLLSMLLSDEFYQEKDE